jgi:threonine/homoserine/homoserine lactone efflux protein
VAIAGTIIANMLLKMFVAAAYGRRRGRVAVLGLAASTAVLGLTVTVGLMLHFGLT